MKIISFTKEFWKQNRWGFLFSSIVVSIGSLIIYAKNAKVFDISEWFMWLPLPIGLLFIIAFSLGFFLNYSKFE